MTITFDRARLAELAGPIGAAEFDRATSSEQEELWEWLNKLPGLSDQELYDTAVTAINASMNADRHRWDIHLRADACSHQADERYLAAGHSNNCYGVTIYDRAHDEVMRRQRRQLHPRSGCSCGKGGT